MIVSTIHFQIYQDSASPSYLLYLTVVMIFDQNLYIYFTKDVIFIYLESLALLVRITTLFNFLLYSHNILYDNIYFRLKLLLTYLNSSMIFLNDCRVIFTFFYISFQQTKRAFQLDLPQIPSLKVEKGHFFCNRYIMG